jgi:hypothetical protein
MYIEESVNMKFLGLQIDNHLNWTNHIDKLIPKLHGARHAVRSMCHISNTDTLKSIYFDYFHLIMNNFGGKSSNSTKTVTLQKKTVRFTAGINPRIPCKSLFKSL